LSLEKKTAIIVNWKQLGLWKDCACDETRRSK
jgi:hypothetical protein